MNYKICMLRECSCNINKVEYKYIHIITYFKLKVSCNINKVEYKYPR